MVRPPTFAGAHRRVIARAGAAAAPPRDDRQGVHAAVPQGGPDRAAGGPEQAGQLGPGQARRQPPRGVDPGVPEELIGQQPGYAGDPLLRP